MPKIYCRRLIRIRTVSARSSVIPIPATTMGFAKICGIPSSVLVTDPFWDPHASSTTQVCIIWCYGSESIEFRSIEIRAIKIYTIETRAIEIRGQLRLGQLRLLYDFSHFPILSKKNRKIRKNRKIEKIGKNHKIVSIDRISIDRESQLTVSQLTQSRCYFILDGQNFLNTPWAFYMLCGFVL